MGLKFAVRNSKLNKLAKYLGLHYNQVVSFDLPAGWSCPKANICKTFSDRERGNLTKKGRVTCYAAKGEAFAPSVRRLRWSNFDLIKSNGRDVSKIAEMILTDLPNKVKIVRIHSSGDLFWREYFEAWCKVAAARPEIIFFGYTKHLDYSLSDLIPQNMFLQYSYGSKDDSRYDVLEVKPPTCFIGENDGDYPNIRVVCGSDDTSHEDYLAILNKQSFVILAH